MADYQLTDFSTVVRASDGASIPFDPRNRDYDGYLAWLADGNTPDPAPVALPSPIISVQQFWQRFTPAERQAIATFAQTNPAIAQTMVFALALGQVDLVSGPIVSQWMASLVSAGIITQDRATAILTP